MGEDVASACVCPGPHTFAASCDVHGHIGQPIDVRLRVGRCIVCKEFSLNWMLVPKLDGGLDKITYHDTCTPGLIELYPEMFNVPEEPSDEF